jgi:ABC-2 type transport system ATP-binding protein
MIEMQSLCKSYGHHPALEGFSLRVETGELFGLVGPNGAGKTTLIKILATLLPPDSGNARIDGHDVVAEPSAVRASAGYLPDIAGLYQDMRVEEFLEFFADAFHLHEPRRRRSIEQALQRAGLAGRRHDFVEQLSLGMKQRLVLAKTLLHEPKVLLLDEPATGLDPLARVELRNLLKELNREGLTIFLSSHILSDLEDICTRVALIAGGRNSVDAGGQSVITLSGSAANQAAPNVICEIEVVGDVQVAAGAAREIAGASVLSTEGQRLHIELSGGVAQGSALLQRLLAAGLTVMHFDLRGPSLEERYRQAFEGKESRREDMGRRGETS